MLKFGELTSLKTTSELFGDIQQGKDLIVPLHAHIRINNADFNQN